MLIKQVITASEGASKAARGPGIFGTTDADEASVKRECASRSPADLSEAGAEPTGSGGEEGRASKAQAQIQVLRLAACAAFDRGDVAEARQFVIRALQVDPSVQSADEWMPIFNVSDWPDSWLISAVRNDPPDMPALDALAARYWRPLFGQCRLLTLKHHEAHDLAQAAWCRVLRARQSLKPEGNFPAYLATVATNLWRDLHRSACRAGPMASSRLISLDAIVTSDRGAQFALGDSLPDLNALQKEEQRLLMLDIDHALEQLTLSQREVLVARFISGESCAEIADRIGRTEQTVNGWIRQAVRTLKLLLSESLRTSARGDKV